MDSCEYLINPLVRMCFQIFIGASYTWTLKCYVDKEMV